MWRLLLRFASLSNAGSNADSHASHRASSQKKPFSTLVENGFRIYASGASET
jgi:hypothetical protein